jgi:hypothetical protein
MARVNEKKSWKLFGILMVLKMGAVTADATDAAAVCAHILSIIY